MRVIEFIQSLSQKTQGAKQDDIRKIVHLVFEHIYEVLSTGESVRIPKVGSLYLKYYPRRKDWKNPFTGNEEPLKSRVKLKFRPNVRFQQKLTEDLDEMFAMDDIGDEFDSMSFDDKSFQA